MDSSIMPTLTSTQCSMPRLNDCLVILPVTKTNITPRICHPARNGLTSSTNVDKNIITSLSPSKSCCESPSIVKATSSVFPLGGDCPSNEVSSTSFLRPKLNRLDLCRGEIPPYLIPPLSCIDTFVTPITDFVTPRTDPTSVESTNLYECALSRSLSSPSLSMHTSGKAAEKSKGWKMHVSRIQGYDVIVRSDNSDKEKGNEKIQSPNRDSAKTTQRSKMKSKRTSSHLKEADDSLDMNSDNDLSECSADYSGRRTRKRNAPEQLKATRKPSTSSYHDQDSSSVCESCRDSPNRDVNLNSSMKTRKKRRKQTIHSAANELLQLRAIQQQYYVLSDSDNNGNPPDADVSVSDSHTGKFLSWDSSEEHARVNDLLGLNDTLQDDLKWNNASSTNNFTIFTVESDDDSNTDRSSRSSDKFRDQRKNVINVWTENGKIGPQSVFAEELGPCNGMNHVAIEDTINRIYSVHRRSVPDASSGPDAPLYGEMTLKSFLGVLLFLRRNCGLSDKSIFLDLGSGSGFPNFIAAPFVKVSVGIETDYLRWMISNIGLKNVLMHVPSMSEMKPNIFFMHADAHEFETINGVTHWYMFNIGFPEKTMRHIANAFNCTSTAKYLICFQKPRTILNYGFNVYDEPVGTLSTCMRGSGEGHAAFFYEASRKCRPPAPLRSFNVVGRYCNSSSTLPSEYRELNVSMESYKNRIYNRVDNFVNSDRQLRKFHSEDVGSKLLQRVKMRMPSGSMCFGTINRYDPQRKLYRISFDNGSSFWKELPCEDIVLVKTYKGLESDEDSGEDTDNKSSSEVEDARKTSRSTQNDVQFCVWCEHQFIVTKTGSFCSQTCRNNYKNSISEVEYLVAKMAEVDRQVDCLRLQIIKWETEMCLKSSSHITSERDHCKMRLQQRLQERDAIVTELEKAREVEELYKSENPEPVQQLAAVPPEESTNQKRHKLKKHSKKEIKKMQNTTGHYCAITTCDRHEYPYSTPWTLRKHARSKHFMCPRKCFSYFNTSEEMQKHVETCHSEDSNFDGDDDFTISDLSDASSFTSASSIPSRRSSRVSMSASCTATATATATVPATESAKKSNNYMESITSSMDPMKVVLEERDRRVRTLTREKERLENDLSIFPARKLRIQYDWTVNQLNETLSDNWAQGFLRKFTKY